MTFLKKVPLPKEILTEALILKSLNSTDIINEHFSITDLPFNQIGTMADMPAATVVFDLSGSTLNIRDRGAKAFAAEAQYLFKKSTDIIYEHKGIIEKFPGDGISMHFPANELGRDVAISNACTAILEMDYFIRKELKLDRDRFRFTLTYGEDTIITSFGSEKHLELISIGDAVNVAHKLEKHVKDKACFLGVDYKCINVAKKVLNQYLFEEYCMPSELITRTTSILFPSESWYGLQY
ncbi:hypothetical protein [Priestia koreensis]|uniref:Guanylate cyclase domain-containing protein n=1 Tax=Priestia koreensis TaxID=284581 RepID=A0A0M0KXF8_9BACI|nr:hypothetical protein [Priestia koreensis]KOO43083.1 hypothetical protein AMD01_16170 [Priestia koreensis]